MSSSSDDTSSHCKSKVEGEIMSSKPNGCVCSLTNKKKVFFLTIEKCWDLNCIFICENSTAFDYLSYGSFFLFAAKAKGVVTYHTGIQSSHEYYSLHLGEMLGLQLSVP